MDFKQHFERSWQTMANFFPSILIVTLLFLGLSMATLGIMAPALAAGYMQSLLLALRDGRKPHAKDLLSRLDLLLPLLGLALLLGLSAGIGMTLLVLPGVVVLLAASFFLAYLLPLMTDQDLGMAAAVRESVRMALEAPVVEHAATVAACLALGSIGSSTGIGSLLTHPFCCLFLLSVYEQKRRRLLADATEPASPSSAGS